MYHHQGAVIVRQTNVLGGVSSPCFKPDGKAFVSSVYTNGEFHLFEFPLKDGQGTPAAVAAADTGGGLSTRDGKPPSHFTIAGPDKQFHPATAEIDGQTIVVHSGQVSKPIAVRFAWHDTAEPNLCNKEGLPASPFRTDQFPCQTEARH